MYCRNCGNELQDEWVRCPYCGCDVHNEKITAEQEKPCAQQMKQGQKQIQQTEKIQDNKQQSFEQSKHNEKKIINIKESKEDFLIGSRNISGRLVLRVCALIAIICYFCPMYMVSCGGNEVGKLSGFDFTVGFSYMNQKIPGNIEFGLLLLLPIISFAGIGCSKLTEMDLEKRAKEFREQTYISTISMAMVIWLHSAINSRMDEVASESMVQISSLFAQKLGMTVAWIFVAGGTFLAYILEPKEKDGKPRGSITVGVITIAKVIGISIVVLAVLLAILEELFPVEYMQG